MRLKLTQEQLSERIDVTASYFGAVERGEKSMTLEKLIALINEFGVSMDYILSDYIKPNNEDELSGLIKTMTEQQRRLTIEIAKILHKTGNLKE